MKRSEMIEEITKWNSYTDKYDDRSFAEALLDFLESKGMCPPNTYACTNEFRFEWEAENE